MRKSQMRWRLWWCASIATLIATALLVPVAARSDTGPSRPAPQIFAAGLISAGAEGGAPTFSPDGRTLYFERTNSKWSAILESHLTRGQWTKRVLAAFSGATSDQQPSFSPDGRYLIFVSSRPSPSSAGEEPKFANHLYGVDRTALGWSAAIELPAEVNISARVFKPSIA